jgi:HlyD family secretion protein
MTGHRETYDDVLDRRDRARPRDVGPQGEALILELQRLRQAFERDEWNEAHTPPPRRPPKNGAQPAGPQRRRAPKRRKKRGMGRVIEICLSPFGLNSDAAEPVARRTQSSPPPHAAPRPRAAPPPQAAARPDPAPRPQTAPPERSKPQPHADQRPRKQRPVTLVAPVAMDLSKPGPEIAGLKPLASAGAPRVDPPLLESLRQPDTRFGQLVAHCRTGVAFLLSQDEPAQEGDNLASTTGRTFTR